MTYIKDNDFEKLIDQYSKLIFTICLSITKDRLDSEDLTQETFLSAYKRISTVNDENLKAWLSKIAINKCRDHLRKNRRRIYTIPFDEDILINDSVSMEEAAVTNEEYRCMEAAILSLKEPYRSAAYHYFIKGISLAEYGAEKNIPLKTLQTQIRRAKKMIKTKYKEVYNNEFI